MGEILVLALSAAFSPTLFAAVMVMLLSTSAKRLMLGCLLGAYLVSFTLGLVIIFALPHSSAVRTTRNTLSPTLDLVLGMIAVGIAIVLSSGLGDRVKTRREQRKPAKEQKGPPRWRQALDQGSTLVAIVVGALLGFPGVSYLVALGLIHKQDWAAGAVIAAVLLFCLIMLVIVELPLLGFALAPEGTVKVVARFKAWFIKDARQIAMTASLVVGALLLVRGTIEILS